MISFILTQVAPVVSEVVASQPDKPQAIGLLEGLSQSLSGLESAPILVTVAVAVELSLRLIKSEKPRSILYYVADGLKLCGNIFTKAGLILDKVLPQRMKEPKA